MTPRGFDVPGYDGKLRKARQVNLSLGSYSARAIYVFNPERNECRLGLAVFDLATEAEEARMIELLGSARFIRGPSDAARAVAPSDARADWEPLMGPARDAAARLVAAGKLVVTQRGKVVDLACARGAIRLKLPPRAP